MTLKNFTLCKLFRFFVQNDSFDRFMEDMRRSLSNLLMENSLLMLEDPLSMVLMLDNDLSIPNLRKLPAEQAIFIKFSKNTKSCLV